jgi:3-hydroxybutyrate dehydrogenase
MWRPRRGTDIGSAEEKISMLKGKCALVTGSTGGLGLSIIRALAAEGCNVVLNGLPAQMDGVVGDIKKQHGVEAVFHEADLSKPAEIERMIAAVNAQFGGVDILVNNAVIRHFAPIEQFPVERWDNAVAVNLSACFHTIRLTLPHMRAKGWGRIINMASIYSSIGIANRVDYVTTKTAILGMTRAIAHETIDANITVNALCPGAVLTETNDARIEELARTKGLTRKEADRQFLEGKQPGGRFVESSSVAAMAVFLCSEAAADIRAAAIPIDLGWNAS